MYKPQTFSAIAYRNAYNEAYANIVSTTARLRDLNESELIIAHAVAEQHARHLSATAIAKYNAFIAPMNKMIAMRAAAGECCGECGNTEYLMPDAVHGTMCMPCAAGERGVDW
jgi:hypothetical protein